MCCRVCDLQVMRQTQGLKELLGQAEGRALALGQEVARLTTALQQSKADATTGQDKVCWWCCSLCATVCMARPCSRGRHLTQSQADLPTAQLMI